MQADWPHYLIPFLLAASSGGCLCAVAPFRRWKGHRDLQPVMSQEPLCPVLEGVKQESVGCGDTSPGV